MKGKTTPTKQRNTMENIYFITYSLPGLWMHANGIVDDLNAPATSASRLRSVDDRDVTTQKNDPRWKSQFSAIGK